MKAYETEADVSIMIKHNTRARKKKYNSHMFHQQARSQQLVAEYNRDCDLDMIYFHYSSLYEYDDEVLSSD